MSYMIKHNKFGVYQGSFMGVGFWHPTSRSPEFGVCEFDSTFDAEGFVNFLCSNECPTIFNREDLRVLLFDEILNIRLLGASAFVGPFVEVKNARR